MDNAEFHEICFLLKGPDITSVPAGAVNESETDIILVRELTTTEPAANCYQTSSVPEFFFKMDTGTNSSYLLHTLG